jgi:hypothetical protein
MTLAEWSARYSCPVYTHPSGAKYVYLPFYEETRQRVEIFRLTDYRISTISGPTIWLVPRPAQ